MKAVKCLQNNKAVGFDQINNEMIKSSIDFTAPALKNIFNAMHFQKSILSKRMEDGDNTKPQ